MGMLDKRIQVAVNNALQPLESKLIKMAEENAGQNRELMLNQAEVMNKNIEALVEEKVKEALEKNVSK